MFVDMVSMTKLLSDAVIQLQISLSRLYPPSRFGLESAQINVATAPSTFMRLGWEYILSFSPPSHFTKLGENT